MAYGLDLVSYSAFKELFTDHFCFHYVSTVRDLLGEWQAQLQLWLVRTAGLDQTAARTVSFVILVAASVVIAVVVLVLILRIVSEVLGAIAYVACCRCLRKSAKKAKAPAVLAK